VSSDGIVTLWQRLRGEALFLAQRRRAAGALATAFPDLASPERVAIARRSAWLQARLRGERFATRDAVRLCRDLAIDGAPALQQLRETTAAEAAVFSAALGAPTLAVRAVGLYGGDPQRAVHLLPMAGGEASFAFLGRTVRCSTDWYPRSAAWLFPVFAHLEPGGRARVVFETPLPVARHDEGATGVALAAIERAVRAQPEAWPWGAWPSGAGLG